MFKLELPYKTQNLVKSQKKILAVVTIVITATGSWRARSVAKKLLHPSESSTALVYKGPSGDIYGLVCLLSQHTIKFRHMGILLRAFPDSWRQFTDFSGDSEAHKSSVLRLETLLMTLLQPK